MNNFHSTKFNSIQRIFASLVLFVFLLQSTGLSQPELSAVFNAPAKEFSKLTHSIEIPQEWGEIQSIFDAPQSESLILHIEDAHANYEAQKNIQAMIQHLVENYGFKLLLLEGANERLDPGLFQFFEDHSLNLKVADTLLRHGEFTGAEMFLLAQSKIQDPSKKKDSKPLLGSWTLPASPAGRNPASNIQAYGIEDTDLYRKDIILFRKILKSKKVWGEFLTELESSISILESRFFSNALRDFVREWRKKRAEGTYLLRFVDTLSKEAQAKLSLDLKSPINQDAYPALVRVLKLKDIEPKLDLKKIQEERTALLDFLKGKIDDSLFRELSSLDLKAKGKPEKNPRFALEKVFEQTRRYGLDFKQYPNFSLFAGYLVLQCEVKSKELFREVEELTEKIFEKLAQTEGERTLLQVIKDAVLLDQLFKLELSRAEYETLLKRKEELSPTNVVARISEIKKLQVTGHKSQVPRHPSPVQNPKSKILINKVKGRLHFVPPPLARGLKPRASTATEAPPSRPGAQSTVETLTPDPGSLTLDPGPLTIDSLFQDALNFYRLAEEREHHFIEKTFETMKRENQTRAILVTGGFHTQGLQEMIQTKGLSYVRVSPKMADAEQGRATYLRAMLGENRKIEAKTIEVERPESRDSGTPFGTGGSELRSAERRPSRSSVVPGADSSRPAGMSPAAAESQIALALHLISVASRQQLLTQRYAEIGNRFLASILLSIVASAHASLRLDRRPDLSRYVPSQVISHNPVDNKSDYKPLAISPEAASSLGTESGPIEALQDRVGQLSQINPGVSQAVEILNAILVFASEAKVLELLKLIKGDREQKLSHPLGEELAETREGDEGDTIIHFKNTPAQGSANSSGGTSFLGFPQSFPPLLRFLRVDSNTNLVFKSAFLDQQVWTVNAEEFRRLVSEGSIEIISVPVRKQGETASSMGEPDAITQAQDHLTAVAGGREIEVDSLMKAMDQKHIPLYEQTRIARRILSVADEYEKVDVDLLSQFVNEKLSSDAFHGIFNKEIMDNSGMKSFFMGGFVYAILTGIFIKSSDFNIIITGLASWTGLFMLASVYSAIQNAKSKFSHRWEVPHRLEENVHHFLDSNGAQKRESAAPESLPSPTSASRAREDQRTEDTAKSLGESGEEVLTENTLNTNQTLNLTLPSGLSVQMQYLGRDFAVGRGIPHAQFFFTYSREVLVNTPNVWGRKKSELRSADGNWNDEAIRTLVSRLRFERSQSTIGLSQGTDAILFDTTTLQEYVVHVKHIDGKRGLVTLWISESLVAEAGNEPGPTASSLGWLESVGKRLSEFADKAAETLESNPRFGRRTFFFTVAAVLGTTGYGEKETARPAAVASLRTDEKAQNIDAETLDAIQKSLRELGTYLSPSVGIHGPTGMPQDHVQLDPQSHRIIGNPVNYSAPSKLGVYFPFLLKAAQGHPMLKQTGVSEEQALELMKKALQSLRKFQRDGEAKNEIYGGLFPWFEMQDNGTLNIAKYNGRYMIPTLDNGQLTFALAAVAGAFWNEKTGPKKEIRDLARQILDDQHYEKFVNPATGLLYAEWDLERKRGVDKPGHISLWTEWAIPFYWAHLRGIISDKNWLKISNDTFALKMAGKSIDMPQGFIFSQHELWGLIYMPFMQSGLAPLMRNYLFRQTKHARDGNIPGLVATEYDPRGSYVQAGINLARRGEGLVLGRIDREDLATPYGTALASLVNPKAGASWFRYLIEQPGVVGPYGPVTSFTRKEGASSMYSGDSTFMVATALSGGVFDDVASYYKGRYGKEKSDLVAPLDRQAQAILVRLKRRSFSAVGPDEILLPPAKRDTSVMQPREKKRSGTIDISARLKAGHKHGDNVTWVGDVHEGKIEARYVINVRGPKPYAWLGTEIEPASIAGANYISFWVPADLKGETWQIELKNSSVELTPRIEVYLDGKGELSADKKWRRIILPIRLSDTAKRLDLNYFGISVPDPRFNRSRDKGTIHIKGIQLHQNRPETGKDLSFEFAPESVSQMVLVADSKSKPKPKPVGNELVSKEFKFRFFASMGEKLTDGNLSNKIDQKTGILHITKAGPTSWAGSGKTEVLDKLEGSGEYKYVYLKVKGKATFKLELKSFFEGKKEFKVDSKDWVTIEIEIPEGASDLSYFAISDVSAPIDLADFKLSKERVPGAKLRGTILEEPTYIALAAQASLAEMRKEGHSPSRDSVLLASRLTETESPSYFSYGASLGDEPVLAKFEYNFVVRQAPESQRTVLEVTDLGKSLKRTFSYQLISGDPTGWRSNFKEIKGSGKNIEEKDLPEDELSSALSGIVALIDLYLEDIKTPEGLKDGTDRTYQDFLSGLETLETGKDGLNMSLKIRESEAFVTLGNKTYRFDHANDWPYETIRDEDGKLLYKDEKLLAERNVLAVQMVAGAMHLLQLDDRRRDALRQFEDRTDQWFAYVIKESKESREYYSDLLNLLIGSQNALMRGRLGGRAPGMKVETIAAELVRGERVTLEVFIEAMKKGEITAYLDASKAILLAGIVRDIAKAHQKDLDLLENSVEAIRQISVASKASNSLQSIKQEVDQWRDEVRRIAEVTRQLQALGQSTHLLEWKNRLAYLKQIDEENVVQVKITLARGVQILLPIHKEVYRKYPDLTARYLASIIHTLSILYGTDFIAVGSNNQLVADSTLAGQVTGVLDQSFSNVSNFGFGLKELANLGRPVPTKPQSDLDQHQTFSIPVSSTDYHENYPGRYLGIDIGGSYIKFNLRNGGQEESLPETLQKIETTPEFRQSEKETGSQFIYRVIYHVTEIIKKMGDIDGVAIVIPGAIDKVTNRNVTFGQLPVTKKWNDADIDQARELHDRVAQALNKPVTVRNDMDGIGQAIASLLGIRNAYIAALGTGLGTQVIVNGKLLDGPTELGHVVTDFGRGGTVYATEATTSIPSILKVARDKGFQFPLGEENKIKPIGDAASDEKDSQHAKALEILAGIAPALAQNFITVYELLKDTGVTGVNQVVLAGGVTSGQTGKIIADFVTLELDKAGYAQKLSVRVIPEEQIDVSQIGAMGAAILAERNAQDLAPIQPGASGNSLGVSLSRVPEIDPRLLMMAPKTEGRFEKNPAKTSEIARFAGHEEESEEVTFSQNTGLVDEEGHPIFVSASQDGTVRFFILNIKASNKKDRTREIASFKGSKDYNVFFSQNTGLKDEEGHPIFVSASQDGTVRFFVLNIKAGNKKDRTKEIASFKGGKNYSVRFSQYTGLVDEEGHPIFVSAGNAGAVRFFVLNIKAENKKERTKEIASFKGHAEWVNFSQNTGLVDEEGHPIFVSAGDYGIVKFFVLDIQAKRTKEIASFFTGDKDYWVNFSQNTGLVDEEGHPIFISADVDGTVKFFVLDIQAKRTKEIASFTGHSGLYFSQNTGLKDEEGHPIFISADVDGTVKFFVLDIKASNKKAQTREITSFTAHKNDEVYFSQYTGLKDEEERPIFVSASDDGIVKFFVLDGVVKSDRASSLGGGARSDTKGAIGLELPATLNAWREDIDQFTAEERAIFERALRIRDLKVGFDLEQTITTNFPSSGILDLKNETVSPEVITDDTPFDFQDLKSRLVYPGMKPLLLGLLAHNHIKIITAMRDITLHKTLSDWIETIPFLKKLLATEGVELIEGNAVERVAKETFTRSFELGRYSKITAYSLNNEPLTEEEIDGSVGLINIHTHEPHWRSLKAPDKFGVDVLFEDRFVLVGLMKRLEMGTVIPVPGYELQDYWPMKIGGKWTLPTALRYHDPSFRATSLRYYYPLQGEIDNVPITDEASYRQSVSAILPALGELEEFFQAKSTSAEAIPFGDGKKPEATAEQSSKNLGDSSRIEAELRSAERRPSRSSVVPGAESSRPAGKGPAASSLGQSGKYQTVVSEESGTRFFLGAVSNTLKDMMRGLYENMKLKRDSGEFWNNVVVLPPKLFNGSRNYGELEFLVYFDAFVKNSLFNSALPRLRVVGTEKQLTALKKYLQHTIFGPDWSNPEVYPWVSPQRRKFFQLVRDEYAVPAPGDKMFPLERYLETIPFDANGTAVIQLKDESGAEKGKFKVSQIRPSLPLREVNAYQITQEMDGTKKDLGQLAVRYDLPKPLSYLDTEEKLQAARAEIRKAKEAAYAETWFGTGTGFDPTGDPTSFILWLEGKGIWVDPSHEALQYMEALGLSDEDVPYVLLTHVHQDHDGGLLERILLGRKVNLIASRVVYEEFKAKANLLLEFVSSNLKFEDLVTWNENFDLDPDNEKPLTLKTHADGKPITLQSWWNFHPIPTNGFWAEYDGFRYYHSGDTEWPSRPRLLQNLVDQEVLSSEEAEQYEHRFWDENGKLHADVHALRHEAGGPPIHTTLASLSKLPEETRRVMQIYHVPDGQVKPEMGLAKAQAFKTTVFVPSDEALRKRYRIGNLLNNALMKLKRGGGEDDFLRVFAEKAGAPKIYQPGKTLILEGQRIRIAAFNGTQALIDDQGHVYFIVKGRAAVYVGDEKKAVLGPGSQFGDWTIATGEPRAATVKVEGDEPLEVYRLQSDTFEEFFGDPETKKRILWVKENIEVLEEWVQRTASTVFQDLLNFALEVLAGNADKRVYKDGEIVIREGDQGDEVFLVASGQTEILKGKGPDLHPVLDKKSGQPIVLERPGLFGHIAILRNLERSATVRAKGDLTVLVFKKEIFLALLDHYPLIRAKVEGQIDDQTLELITDYVEHPQFKDTPANLKELRLLLVQLALRYNRRPDIIRTLLNLMDKKNVVDLFSGPKGEVVSQLRGLGFSNVRGVDREADAAKPFLIQGDITNLKGKIADASIDVAFITGYLQNDRMYETHPKEFYDDVAGEVARILKPGGVLYLISGDEADPALEHFAKFRLEVETILEGNMYAIKKPAAEAKAIGAERSAAGEGPAAASLGKGIQRVLVVDDTDYIREIVSAYIKLWGSSVEVETAEDGEKGLEKYRQAVEAEKPFDLVITDINMSNMDGPAMVRKINPDGRATTVLVIMMTGEMNLNQAAINKLVEARQIREEVLEKPIGLENFKTLLHKINGELSAASLGKVERLDLATLNEVIQTSRYRAGEIESLINSGEEIEDTIGNWPDSKLAWFTLEMEKILKGTSYLRSGRSEIKLLQVVQSLHDRILENWKTRRMKAGDDEQQASLEAIDFVDGLRHALLERSQEILKGLNAPKDSELNQQARAYLRNALVEEKRQMGRLMDPEGKRVTRDGILETEYSDDYQFLSYDHEGDNKDNPKEYRFRVSELDEILKQAAFKKFYKGLGGVVLRGKAAQRLRNMIREGNAFTTSFLAPQQGFTVMVAPRSYTKNARARKWEGNMPRHEALHALIGVNGGKIGMDYQDEAARIKGFIYEELLTLGDYVLRRYHVLREKIKNNEDGMKKLWDSNWNEWLKPTLKDEFYITHHRLEAFHRGETIEDQALEELSGKIDQAVDTLRLLVDKEILAEGKLGEWQLEVIITELGRRGVLMDGFIEMFGRKREENVLSYKRRIKPYLENFVAEVKARQERVREQMIEASKEYTLAPAEVKARAAASLGEGKEAYSVERIAYSHKLFAIGYEPKSASSLGVFDSQHTRIPLASSKMVLPLTRLGGKVSRSELNAGITSDGKGGWILTTTIPGVADGGYNPTLEKSLSPVNNVLLLETTIRNMAPFLSPFGTEITSWPSFLRNWVMSMWMFSSTRNRNLFNLGKGDELFLLNSQDGVMDSRFDRFLIEGGESPKNILKLHAALEEFKNRGDRNSGSTEYGFPMTYVLIDANPAAIAHLFFSTTGKDSTIPQYGQPGYQPLAISYQREPSASSFGKDLVNRETLPSNLRDTLHEGRDTVLLSAASLGKSEAEAVIQTLKEELRKEREEGELRPGEDLPVLDETLENIARDLDAGRIRLAYGLTWKESREELENPRQVLKSELIRVLIFLEPNVVKDGIKYYDLTRPIVKGFRGRSDTLAGIEELGVTETAPEKGIQWMRGGQGSNVRVKSVFPSKLEIRAMNPKTSQVYHDTLFFKETANQSFGEKDGVEKHPIFAWVLQKKLEDILAEGLVKGNIDQKLAKEALRYNWLLSFVAPRWEDPRWLTARKNIDTQSPLVRFPMYTFQPYFPDSQEGAVHYQDSDAVGEERGSPWIFRRLLQEMSGLKYEGADNTFEHAAPTNGIPYDIAWQYTGSKGERFSNVMFINRAGYYPEELDALLLEHEKDFIGPLRRIRSDQYQAISQWFTQTPDAMDQLVQELNSINEAIGGEGAYHTPSKKEKEVHSVVFGLVGVLKDRWVENGTQKRIDLAVSDFDSRIIIDYIAYLATESRFTKHVPENPQSILKQLLSILAEQPSESVTPISDITPPSPADDAKAVEAERSAAGQGPAAQSLGRSAGGIDAEVLNYSELQGRSSPESIIHIADAVTFDLYWLKDAVAAVVNFYRARLGLVQEPEVSKLISEWSAAIDKGIFKGQDVLNYLGITPLKNKMPLAVFVNEILGENQGRLSKAEAARIAKGIANSLQPEDLFLGVVTASGSDRLVMSELYQAAKQGHFRAKAIPQALVSNSMLASTARRMDNPLVSVSGIREAGDSALTLSEMTRVRFDVKTLQDAGINLGWAVGLLRQVADHPDHFEKLGFHFNREGYWEVGSGFVALLEKVYTALKNQNKIAVAA